MSDSVQEELDRLKREREEAKRKTDEAERAYRDALAKHKPNKIGEIVHIVHEFDISQAELCDALKWPRSESKTNSVSAPAKGKARAPMLYRHPETGEEHSGLGKSPPVWIKEFKQQGREKEIRISELDKNPS